MIPLLVGFAASSAGYPVLSYYGNSECYSIDKQIITTHEIIAKPLGNCIIITDSQFVACKSPIDNGGAILFSSMALNSSLYCASTVFENCFSDTRGGGLYVRCSDVTIVQNCAYHCQAGIEGQYAYLRQVHSRSDINETAMVSCSDAGEAPLSAQMTTTIIYRLNSSCNSVASGCAGVKLYSEYVSMRECDFSNSRGSWIVVCNSAAKLTDISTINVVGNTATQGIIFFNGQWTITNTIFQTNAGRYYHNTLSNSELNFVKCVFDVPVEGAGNVKFSSCQFSTATETFDIKHINTELCLAGSAGGPDIPTEPPEESVWEKSEVIGALVGGTIGALILGLAIGLLINWKRKGTVDSTVELSTSKLLSNNYSQFSTSFQ